MKGGRKLCCVKCRRNELVAMDLVITIVAAALGLIAAIAGICGMLSRMGRHASSQSWETSLACSY